MLPFRMVYRKRKPKRFSLICLPLARQAKGSLSFACYKEKKQSEVNKKKLSDCNELNRLDGLAHLCRHPSF